MDSVQAGEVQSFGTHSKTDKCYQQWFISGNLKTFGDMRMHMVKSLCIVIWCRGKRSRRTITSSHNQICKMDMEVLILSAKNIHSPEAIIDPEFIAEFQEEEKLGQSLIVESRANHWSSWNRNCSSFKTRSYQNIWGTDHKREKSILRRRGRSQCQSSCSEFQLAQTTKPNQKKQILPKRTVRAPGNRAATKTRQVLAEWDRILFNSKRIQCASRREPLTLRNECRRKFQKYQWYSWCSTSTRMNGK